MSKTQVKTYADLEKKLADRQMVDRIIGLTDMKEQLPDDVTVLVVGCERLQPATPHPNSSLDKNTIRMPSGTKSVGANRIGMLRYASSIRGRDGLMARQNL